MPLPFINSTRILLLTFLKLLSGIEGEPASDWGVNGNISLCDCSRDSDWLFSGVGRACMTSSSCCASLFCPGTNECERDTPRLTTGALIAAANSSSALKGDKNVVLSVNFLTLRRRDVFLRLPACFRIKCNEEASTTLEESTQIGCIGHEWAFGPQAKQLNTIMLVLV